MATATATITPHASIGMGLTITDRIDVCTATNAPTSRSSSSGKAMTVVQSVTTHDAVAGTILQEKEDGTFRRLLIAPIQKYALLGGKVLAQFILTSLQIFILFAFGYIFFHIHINNPLAVILLILGTSFGTTGLGIALVSLVKTRRQLNPIVTIVTLVSSVISGIFFPSWLLPSWLQQFAHITLPAWASEGLNNVMIYGKDLNYVLPDILGLFVYGLICYIIALRLFRFQEKAA